VKISFLGAAREVTGSCYVVETDGCRFLVDCGLFQGGRDAPRKNLGALAFDPASIDFVLVTHSHLDHCGLLPRLVAKGCRAPVYATKATADLMPVMLMDSAHIQEKEAAWSARHPQRGRPAFEALYGVADVEDLMRQVSGLPFDIEFSPHPDVHVRFRHAGHILGAAIIEVRVGEGRGERKLVFSGDLGQPMRPLMREAEVIESADVLLVESTYGNRLHKDADATAEELVAAIDETLHRKHGNLIVPAFALGRTQDLLAMLYDLAKARRVGDLHVFVDSPLAKAATDVTLAHVESLDPRTRPFIEAMRHRKLPFSLHFTESVEDSMAINMIRSGAIIIAASGMCDAGRIKHHLKYNLGRAECGILFTGFQAAGTLGRRIVDGARSVTLFGEPVPVKARVYTLGGLSAHADQAALLGWLRGFRKAPSRTFVVHGEESTALAFSAAITEQLGWNVTVPGPGETIAIAG